MDEVFSISSLEHGDGVITATLSINPHSSIFKGHFPGQPVVPGACMLDAVRGVLEKALGLEVVFKKASLLKFVGMIDPLITASVLVEIAYKIISDEVNVNGKLMDGERVCFKFQGIYTK